MNRLSSQDDDLYSLILTRIDGKPMRLARCNDFGGMEPGRDSDVQHHYEKSMNLDLDECIGDFSRQRLHVASLERSGVMRRDAPHEQSDMSSST